MKNQCGNCHISNHIKSDDINFNEIETNQHKNEMQQRDQRFSTIKQKQGIYVRDMKKDMITIVYILVNSKQAYENHSDYQAF